MKISYRILLINFAVVVLILSSSAFAFYSIMYEVLTSQQSKYLLNSANNLVYTLSEFQQIWYDDLQYLKQAGFSNTGNAGYNIQDIDFVLEDAGEGRLKVVQINQELVNIPAAVFTLSEFNSVNPYSFINSYEENDNRIFYFGKIISKEFLTLISKRINSEIAIFNGGIPGVLSNEHANQKHIQALLDLWRYLDSDENFRIYTEANGNSDIIATIYRWNPKGLKLNDIKFLIFDNIREVSALRGSIQNILIILGSAGVILSLILTFLFTDKIRKQVTLLSKATRITNEGNFPERINFKSKDELGELASSFNEMIDKLERNEKTKNEYSEFLTLLNQNPSLTVISDAVLKKIIKSCGFTAGALYSVLNGELSLTSSYGTKTGVKVKEENDLFFTVLKNKEPLELIFDSENPIVSSGIYDISIKYLLLYPVIYNNQVIAILELAALRIPPKEMKEYLKTIQDQMAIGLTNAAAYVQLENLVAELKLLNTEYQKQNRQIREQNESLTALHHKLKEKAEELEIQKEKAEDSAKLKSQFLAGVSHELRTPMNSILGLTELILNDRRIEGKNKERLEVVLKNGKRLMSLINEILDLSKIEAGKMEVFIEDVKLEDILNTAESAVKPIANKKNLKFDIRKEINTDIIVSSDREKITQVLINLLDNAVKFTDSGSVTLTISKEDARLRFRVTDTGIGISEKELEFIFNEFRQVDGSNSRKYNGTGLGLAICKKTAELLNGYITVESELGKGSTFTFVIPVVIPEPGVMKTPEMLESLSLQAVQNKTIVVIDHDSEIKFTIGQYLVSKNYDVIFANTDKEITDATCKIKPSAIILNAMLPNNRSWEILVALKKDPLNKNIPLILLSILHEKNIGYGFAPFEFLLKPLKPENVNSLISDAEETGRRKVQKVLIVDKEFTDEQRKDYNCCQYKVEIVKNVDQIHAAITGYRPDIIIINILMPDKDGIAILSDLKKNRDTRNIPVVLSFPESFNDEQKIRLSSSIERATLEFKAHPLDVLKIIRDRIEVQERGFRKGNADVGGRYEDSELSESLSEEEEIIGEVLIVDDDPDTLFTINEIVKTCNCSTILAKSGKECLEILKNKVPDLILLDIMMPGMDGFQTLKRIRRDFKSTKLPVYAVTARAMAGDKEIILKHGFDDYISKPVNSGVMAFKIEKLLSKLKTV